MPLIICPPKNSAHRIVTFTVLLFSCVWLCGLVQILLGGVIVADENKGVSRFTNFPVGGFAIAVGSLQFLVSFFVCGTSMKLSLKHYPCMLITYMLLLLLFCLLQGILASFALSTIRDDNGDVTRAAQKVVNDLFKHYADDKHDKKLVDNFQSYFECCGVFNDTEWYYNGVGSIPMSCCPDHSVRKCTGEAYDKGCAETFQDIIGSLSKAISGVAIAFAVIEILGAYYAWTTRNRLVHIKEVSNRAQPTAVVPVSNTPILEGHQRT